MFYGIIYTPQGLMEGDKIPIERGRAIDFTLTTWAEIELRIYTIGGRLVRTIPMVNPQFQKGTPDYYAIAPGDYIVIWDGRNDNYEMVAAGNYYTTIFTKALEEPALSTDGGTKFVSTVKRPTTTRTRAEGPIIAEDKQIYAAGEWVPYETLQTPTSAAAGLTTREDLIRKGMSIDDAMTFLGESLPSEISGVPRSLLTPCAQELVRKNLISVNAAYETCATQYLEAQAKQDTGKDTGKDTGIMGMFSSPVVLMMVGGVVLFLMGKKVNEVNEIKT